MVFESLLVDILNIYLKPYVKKIDSSNLNIGVWNGKLAMRDSLWCVQTASRSNSITQCGCILRSHLQVMFT